MFASSCLLVILIANVGDIICNDELTCSLGKHRCKCRLWFLQSSDCRIELKSCACKHHCFGNFCGSIPIGPETFCPTWKCKELSPGGGGGSATGLSTFQITTSVIGLLSLVTVLVLLFCCLKYEWPCESPITTLRRRRRRRTARRFHFDQAATEPLISDSGVENLGVENLGLSERLTSGVTENREHVRMQNIVSPSQEPFAEIILKDTGTGSTQEQND